MPEDDDIEEDIRPPHKLIGAMGIVLLVIYLVLTFGYPQFHAVSTRFLELLTAVFKDFALAFALIPIYLNWVGSDYFQERRKTTLGNAATNGFTGVWVSIIWIRTAYILFEINQNSPLFAAKIFFSVCLFVYAGFIIISAARGRSIAYVIGRVREISYFAIFLTPVVFEVVPLDWITFTAIIAFFPLWHGIIEFMEYYLLPAPGTEG